MTILPCFAANLRIKCLSAFLGHIRSGFGLQIVALKTAIRVIHDIERKASPLQLIGVLMIYNINIYDDKDDDDDVDNPVRPGQLFKLLATS